MKTRSYLTVACFSVFLSACGGDTTAPDEQAETCTDNTGRVVVTVGAGLTPSFTWSPACPIAALLVEEGADDRWFAGAPDNMIAPPVTYGSAEWSAMAPVPLEAGHTYTLSLWRVVPQGANPQCQMRVNGDCAVAIHNFSR